MKKYSNIIKNILLLIILFVFITNVKISFAELDIQLDSAGFMGEEGMTYQEIYYKISYIGLHFTEQRGGKFGTSFEVEVIIYDEDNRIIDTRELKHSAISDTDDPSYNNRKSALGQMSFMLSPNNTYKVIGMVKETDTDTKGYNELVIDIREFDESQFQLSDIEFAGMILADTTGKITPLIKNGLRFFPMPNRTFGENKQWIYIYYEVYNPLAKEGTYKMEYTIYYENGSIAKAYPTRKLRKIGKLGGYVQNLNVANLISGNYILDVKVTNLEEEISTSIQSIFYIKQKPILKESLLDDLEDEEIPLMIEQIKYIANKEEMDMFDNLETIAEKRNALEYFWQLRDHNPKIAGNEALLVFRQRIEYVDETYTTPSREGWKTARGRIFIKYGSPEEIEDHPAELEARAYQVWKYFVSGGRKFIFADRYGSGKYDLIYCNDDSEQSVPNWKKIIFPGVSDSEIEFDIR